MIHVTRKHRVAASKTTSISDKSVQDQVARCLHWKRTRSDRCCVEGNKGREYRYVVDQPRKRSMIE